MTEVCEAMFKSLSEILFRPRMPTPMGEATTTAAADPTFAEEFREIEDISVDTLPGAVFLLTSLRGLTPIGVAPIPDASADLTAEVADSGKPAGEIGGEIGGDGPPSLAKTPTDPLLPPAEAPPSEPAGKTAPLVLVKAICASTPLSSRSPEAPPENEAKAPEAPELAPSETHDGMRKDALPYDLLASGLPLPRAMGSPEQSVISEVSLLPCPPLPLRQAPMEPVDPAQDLTPPIAKNPPAPLTSKAAPLAPPPTETIIASPLQARGDLGAHKDKSVAAISLPVAPELVTIAVAAPPKATTLPPDEAALHFTWRQAMEADAAPPDHTSPPAFTQPVPALPLPPQPVPFPPSPDSPQPPPLPVVGLASHLAPLRTEPTAPDENMMPKDTASARPPLVTARPFADRETEGDQPLVLPKMVLAKPEEAQTPPEMAFAMGQVEAPRHAPPIEIATSRHIPASPVHQVVETLAALPPDTPGRIELTLTPDNLGKLHFDMRPEAGGLSIVLSAERPDTLDLMRRHLPELMAELKQAGVQTGSFSFSSWNGGQRPPPPLQDIDNGRLTAIGATALPPLARRAPPPSGTAGGLDMRF